MILPTRPILRIMRLCQASVTDEANALPRLDLGHALRQFDQPILTDQRGQEPRALARKLYGLQHAVIGLAEADTHIFAAANLLPISESRSNRHRDQILCRST